MPTGIYERDMDGEKHHNWKSNGTERISKPEGRIEIKVNNKWLKKSKYIWLRDNTWGMWFIPDNWVVHHINGNKQDDRIENLVCLPRNYHIALHNELQMRENPDRKYWGINKKGGGQNSHIIL